MNWQDHWHARASFTIFDSGFGDGERFCAVLQASGDAHNLPATLRYSGLACGSRPA